MSGEPTLFDPVAASLDAAHRAARGLPVDRLERLEALSAYIVAGHRASTPIRLHFICTHNSRRSQLGQAWAAAAARWADVPGVEAFSGGTETTAFNPRAVAALRRAGWQIDVEHASAKTPNPVYSARLGPSLEPLRMFSKRIDDQANPDVGFAAVMTCDAADEACPIVVGAALRLNLSYVDPKVADDSDAEVETYDARSQQIATEMSYVFGRARDSF